MVIDMNDFLLQCNGSWEGTRFTLNGENVAACELLLRIETGRNAFGEAVPGGVNNGGSAEVYYRLSDYPDAFQGLFPGRLVLQLPGGSLTIENYNPMEPVVESMQVTFKGQLVTYHLMDLDLHINADQNVMSCFLRIYNPEWLFGDGEIVEYNLI
jgi:hypothetical protein